MKILTEEKRNLLLREARISKYKIVNEKLKEDLLSLLNSGGFLTAKSFGYKEDDMIEILLPTMQNICSKIVNELRNFCRDVQDEEDLIQEIRRGIYEALKRYRPYTNKEILQKKSWEEELEYYFGLKTEQKQQRNYTNFLSFCFFWVKKYLLDVNFPTEIYGITSDNKIISGREIFANRKKNKLKTYRILLYSEITPEDGGYNRDPIDLYVYKHFN